MAIYLVQHGISVSKEIDPDPGLSEEGRNNVQRIAEVAKSYQIRPAQIKHSGKKRARETAEIFKRTLNVKKNLTRIKGIKPLDDVIHFAQSLDGNNSLMIVSHLPFLERLTAYLTTGNPNVTVFKFQNSGIVCLDQLPIPYGWVIKWAFMPNIT
ncbi:MAG: phosphohistidine phosphatase SixA [Desulfobacteraceae bacterium]|nr:phosphohistidine phosphatase SixA [Desulfobacteraceae bacterium]MBC2758131.1 phosphohistidine phosphatase SixA [Desulfobacteraceae bacterium]